MTADVYFMDLGATPRETFHQKFNRLMEKAGIQEIVSPKELTAVKVHFGEAGNTAYIRPIHIRQVVKTLRKAGASPFLTDANTLYVGTRSDAVSHIKTAVDNGFSYSSMDGAPLVIADGLMGKSEVAVPVNLKHSNEVYIGAEIVNATSLVSVAHFKGHELSGFGGTLKNLGMGCASRRGKLAQHSNVSPKIKRKHCIGCAECVDHCPSGALYLKEKKAYINPETCIGCAECIVRCPTCSININWNQTVPVFLEKMMEYTAGVLANKKDKSLFINFITDVSPKCDCLSYNETPICSDIGVVISRDPVAIDQASADLVNKAAALPQPSLTCNHGPGEDKFKGLYPGVDWEHQLEYAQELGLGEREYKLIKMESLSYKKR